MKYLVKIFIFLSLLLCAIYVHAQVTSVQYALLLNPNTNLFDSYIYIHKGQANTVRERIQFNAQYSILVPTGAVVGIESSHMPLTNNQTFTGEQPLKWTISSKLRSPKINPEFDFYSITPTLAPIGFYNKLKQGDLIKLFSLKIEGENVDFSQVRLFDNHADSKSFNTGIKNGDFSNGFTLGGYHQLFNGIININQLEVNYASLKND